MAKILIDIPDETYEYVKQNYRYGIGAEVACNLGFAVAKGTVLPKGHGRLIDARVFEATMYHQAFETDSDMQKWDSGCWIRYKMFENAICDAPTMLEADKEVEK